jgi:hypothetical protein
VSVLELEIMLAGAEEFLGSPAPRALCAELAALPAAAPDSPGRAPERRRHWGTIEAGHATC